MSEITTSTSGKFFPCNIVFIFIQVKLVNGGDAVRSRSLTEFILSFLVEGFEMTEKFNVSFRGLPEKSFSSRTILYETASQQVFYDELHRLIGSWNEVR